jgi:hypothetical protein
MTKNYASISLVLLTLFLSSCKLPLNLNYPRYGSYNPAYCNADPNKQCLTIDLGKLDDPTQYRVVMTTHEYPDNAPPFAGATEIIPLSEDYTFQKPIPNAQRDPFLLQPNQYNVTVELTAIKVKPASPLYFYLIKVSGSGFVPSGEPHITAIAEPYKK